MSNAFNTLASTVTREEVSVRTRTGGRGLPPSRLASHSNSLASVIQRMNRSPAR